MFFTAEAPSVSASDTARPMSRATNVSAFILRSTFVARLPLPIIAERLPSLSLTSFTCAPASLNSLVSRTFAGRSLRACETSPWKALTSTVCCFCRSLTAFVPVQRRPRAASRSASGRMDRRLIASVTV